MRIVHFADLHLGIDNYGAFDPETGLSRRVGDFLNAFDQIIDYAIDERVDAVLFAGDAFKNRDPNPTLQREFARRIGRVSAAGIPIVLLVGNHDLPGLSSRASAAEIYEVLETPGVTVARDIRLHTISTASGLLQIVAVPWISRSMLMQSEAIRNLGNDEFEERVAGAIGDSVSDISRQLDPDLPAVLLGHLTVEGAKVGLERHIMLGSDIEVTPDLLDITRFDYVALGHIHKHQQLHARPPMVYAGSPERVDFGEEREEKGFIVVDIEPGPAPRDVQWEFKELSARRFLTIRVNALGAEPWRTIEAEVSNLAPQIEGAVIRCFITVDRESESLVPALEVRKRLQEYEPFSIGQVVVESESLTRPRMEVDLDDALDPLAMLERWMDRQEVPEERRARYRELARAIVLEERDSHS